MLTAMAAEPAGRTRSRLRVQQPKGCRRRPVSLEARARPPRRPSEAVRLLGTPTLAECDAKLARYRAALDAGADPAIVAGWIAEPQTQRQHADQYQRTPAGPPRDAERGLTTEQITAIIDELGDMITALRDADPTTSSTSTATSACA